MSDGGRRGCSPPQQIDQRNVGRESSFALSAKEYPNGLAVGVLQKKGVGGKSILSYGDVIAKCELNEIYDGLISCVENAKKKKRKEGYL